MKFGERVIISNVRIPHLSLLKRLVIVYRAYISDLLPVACSFLMPLGLPIASWSNFVPISSSLVYLSYFRVSQFIFLIISNSAMFRSPQLQLQLRGPKRAQSLTSSELAGAVAVPGIKVWGL